MFPVNAPNVLTVVRIHGAVGITVISGIDYFFGLRRLMREAPPGAPAR